MKLLSYYVLVVVLFASSVGYAGNNTIPSGNASTNSVFLRIPGVDPSKYVPENLLRLERTLNPEEMGSATGRSRNGAIQGMVNPNSKQLTADSQTWDTTSHQWVSTFTISNTYDANGNMIEGIQKSRYPIDSPLVNSSKSVYSYDGNNNPTEILFYAWINNAWTLNSRTVNTFDASHRVLTSNTFRRVADAWTNLSQTTNSYTTSQNPSETIRQGWSGTAWVNQSRYTATYTDWNDYLQSTSYRWVSNAWSLQSRSTLTYDANHHQLSSLSESGTGGVLTPVYQALNTFDANGDNTEQIYQNWNGTAWFNTGRSVRTFDTQHGILVETYSNWLTDAWVPDSRTTYIYDANHRQYDMTSEVYRGGVWEGSYHWVYTYDIAGNTASYLGQRYINGVWVNDGRAFYTWYGVVAGVNESPAMAAGFKLNANYPNPFNPTTSFSYTVGKAGAVSLTVFDMLGREVANLVNEQQAPGAYTISWNAGNASSGLYYYRLTAGGFVLTNSMMLVK